MVNVAIVYLSTQGNTKLMAEGIAEGARAMNAEVDVKSFYDADVEEVAKADAIAIGSSTFFYKMLDPIEKFLDKLSTTKVNGKIGAAFGSYGWSGEAPGMIADKMREMGIEVIDPVLRILHKPEEKDLEECKRLGKDLVIKTKRKK